MAHQFGVSNVVSVLGTALTEHHVAILRRFADRIVLVFDGDRAGDAAANRAMELFLSQPVEIAIASLPDGMDPDEFLLKNGAEAFNKFLADATDALTYKWRQLVQQLKDKSGLTSRQQAVQQYLETLAAARGSAAVDPIRWGAALARVSRLTETPMEELNQRFRIKTARKRPAVSATASGMAGAAQVSEADQPKSNVSANRLTARQRAEGFILGLLLSEPQRWHKIQQELKPGDFTDDSLRRLAEMFWQHSQDEGEPVFNEFLNLISDVDLKSVAVKWANESVDAIEKDQYLADSLGHIMREREIEERKRLVVGLRQTPGAPEVKQGDVSADIETLRKLQEKARHPDLMRVTL